MDGDTIRRPDSGRMAPDDADSGDSLMQTFLFAMPGALDLIVCEEVDDQDAKAA